MNQYIPLILFSVFTNFGSQILLKKGMTSIDHFEHTIAGLLKALPMVVTNPFIISGILLMMVSMSTHLVVLSKVDISFAYPFIGLSFIFITLYGYFILLEPVNTFRIIGVLSIFIGVLFIAKS